MPTGHPLASTMASRAVAGALAVAGGEESGCQVEVDLEQYRRKDRFLWPLFEGRDGSCGVKARCGKLSAA